MGCVLEDAPKSVYGLGGALPLLIFFSAVRVVVGRWAPVTAFCWSHLRCEGTAFASVFGTPQPCLRRSCRSRQACARHRLFPGGRATATVPPAVLPESAGQRLPTVLSSVFATLLLCLRRLTFFCLARKKSAKKRRWTRFDFYRTATTEAPKLATSCKRTYSPKRNYPLQARQSDSPNLPLAASEALPTMPTAQKPRTLSRVRRNCRP